MGNKRGRTRRQYDEEATLQSDRMGVYWISDCWIRTTWPLHQWGDAYSRHVVVGCVGCFVCCHCTTKHRVVNLEEEGRDKTVNTKAGVSCLYN